MEARDWKMATVVNSVGMSVGTMVMSVGTMVMSVGTMVMSASSAGWLANIRAMD